MTHKQIEVGNLKGSDSPFFFLGIGSCFVQHFEGFAQQHHLPMYCNPLGTSFNPISIGRQLQWLFSNDFPLLPPVDFQGIYHQLDAANKFQDSNSAALQSTTDSIRSEVLDNIKKHQGHQNILILSFGTAHAWMYEDQVVNNCHKLPNPLFERQLLSIEDIVNYWTKMLPIIPEDWTIIYTVSAVKYTKLGWRENTLSKSVLHLVIEQLLELRNNSYYFPSFEIVTDILRDYSYYNEKGTHPTDQAAATVMEHFKTFLDLKGS